ncbi:MAG: response regulator [Myxococcaceae bacterium]|nr:response regulator [Myxococcaceae bacterium]
MEERFKVLVVDDEPDVLQSLSLLLSEDFDVTTAASPESALELNRTRRFDVICSDYKMPRMMGTEFLRQVNTLPDAPSCVMLTGTPALVTPAERVGTDLVTVVGKPFEPARLMRLIEQVARLCQVRRTANEIQRRRGK